MLAKRVWAEVDLDALLHNITTIKENMITGQMMAVVKADAYGHGASVTAPFLEQNGVHYFAVSNLDEAIELRAAGVKGDILILGYTDPSAAEELAKYNIIQSVFTLEYGEKINDAAKNAGVTIQIHIKLDTGMGRIGFHCRTGQAVDQTVGEVLSVFKLDHLSPVGLFTHFAAADLDGDEEGIFTDEQYNLFLKACVKIKSMCGKDLVWHCCNSAATLLAPQKQLDFCRVGIIMYGLTPSVNLKLKHNLKPVMTFKAVVSMVKKLETDATVCYGRTYKAESEREVATVTVGYADGYSRILSNRGYVLIHGKKANIVGKVCMDQMVVDVTGIESVKEGDEVILFGEGLACETVAELCSTINYEIVCDVSRRVPRIYKQNGKTVRVENYLLKP